MQIGSQFWEGFSDHCLPGWVEGPSPVFPRPLELVVDFSHFLVYSCFLNGLSYLAMSFPIIQAKSYLSLYFCPHVLHIVACLRTFHAVNVLVNEKVSRMGVLLMVGAFSEASHRLC